MYQDYFEYNGTKYYSGTQFKLLYTWGGDVIDLAYFVYYDVDNDMVWYQMAYTNQRRGTSMEKFMNNFGGVTGKVADGYHPPVVKQLKDSQIPKLFFGWVWYIALMLVATIFHGAVAFWIGFSVVFFNWRKEVIEKEGYYIER